MSTKRWLTHSTTLALIYSIIFTLGIVTWDAVVPDGTMVAPQPSVRHQEWTTYRVGGMILANPFATDSAGMMPTLVIPEGAVLEVPHWVDGAPPGEVQRKT